MKRTLGTGVLSSMLAVAAGCGGDDGGMNYMPQPTVDSGNYHHFIQNTLKLPKNDAEETQFGLDLDGDGDVDNALGNVMSILTAQGGDIQGQVDEAIASGDIVLLHSIRTDDDTFTNDSTVKWQVYLGEVSSPPTFSGTDMATVAADSPNNAFVTGPMIGGMFNGGPNVVTVQLSLVEGGMPITLNLVGARIKGKLSPTGCSEANLGGAITEEDLDGQVLPAIADMMTDELKDPANMCTATGCTGSSAADFIQKTFDTDDNLEISFMELKNNSLIKTFLKPDVDLLDSSGKFNPRVDGMEESLSLGVRFSCVRAMFTAPGEM